MVIDGRFLGAWKKLKVFLLRDRKSVLSGRVACASLQPESADRGVGLT